MQHGYNEFHLAMNILHDSNVQVQSRGRLCISFSVFMISFIAKRVQIVVIFNTMHMNE